MKKLKPLSLILLALFIAVPCQASENSSEAYLFIKDTLNGLSKIQIALKSDKQRIRRFHLDQAWGLFEEHVRSEDQYVSKISDEILHTIDEVNDPTMKEEALERTMNAILYLGYLYYDVVTTSDGAPTPISYTISNDERKKLLSQIQELFGEGMSRYEGYVNAFNKNSSAAVETPKEEWLYLPLQYVEWGLKEILPVLPTKPLPGQTTPFLPKKVSRPKSSYTTKKTEVKQTSADNESFFVYHDGDSDQNKYHPSGLMGDNGRLRIDAKYKVDPKQGSSCMKVSYVKPSASDQNGWAGLFWQSPANNWGYADGGHDLTGYTKLTFWLKGETGKERLEELKVGGIKGQFPDTTAAGIGPVVLTKEWKRYSIPLTGRNLSYISGGFAWTLRRDQNPGGCTFYLDEIRFER